MSRVIQLSHTIVNGLLKKLKKFAVIFFLFSFYSKRHLRKKNQSLSEFFRLSFGASLTAFLLLISETAIASEALKQDKPKELHRYIIQLKDASLTTYDGNIVGLKSTRLKPHDAVKNKSNTANKNQAVINSKPYREKLDFTNDANQKYLSYLSNQRQTAKSLIEKQLSRKIELIYQFSLSMNGFVAELTMADVEKIRAIPNVKHIERDKVIFRETDRGPTVIGSPEIWNGSATGIEAKGEGIIIAIIDTGINHDHPSFAEVDPVDGYVHINPLGSDVFLGECATTPLLCNDKLIGSYNFVTGETSAEDEHGHGTHVAGTAAGNHVSLQLGNGGSLDISGVAPRANIINYRIGGEDGFGNSSDIQAAIEQAIADNVDVINYSFGSSYAFDDPWSNSSSVAYKSARAAGIFVATSAGNSGPISTTVGSPANSPWLTSVAASTHDRDAFPEKILTSMTGGDTAAPATITGKSITGSITASIVYAGNYVNGDLDPEQCLTPFTPGTFSGEIVVCDRGEIARVEKAENVAAGGAGGYVLANLQDGASFLADDIYVVPGIHIDADSGDTLKAWLASGSGHTATITGAGGGVEIDPDASDIMASFSSRGPNGYPSEVMKPSVSAPGSNIFAASIAPNEYAVLSGTSMASPHVAGAAALLMQLDSTLTPGEVHSILMTTGVQEVKKEDQASVADHFDIGGGRIDLVAASNAALTLDETESNFTNANPETGGEPKALNLPGLIDDSCTLSCTWIRTVKAHQAGTWSSQFSADSGLSLAVSPASFSLTEGQTQSLTITATLSNASDNRWKHGVLELVPSDSALSTTRLPVSVLVVNSNLTDSLALSTNSDSGSHTISGITTSDTQSLDVVGYLTIPSTLSVTLSDDSDNNSPFDDLEDGVSYSLVTVASGSPLLQVSITSSSSNDIDLYLGKDDDGNGQPSSGELVARSKISFSNDESITLNNPESGSYWILIHNVSSLNSDSVNLLIKNFPSQSSNLTFSHPSTVANNTAFDVTMNWTGVSGEGNVYHGILSLESGVASGDLGRAQFTLTRTESPPPTDDDTSSGGKSGGGSPSIALLLMILILSFGRLRVKPLSPYS